jgi:branched-subunit amino acid transport protein
LSSEIPIYLALLAGGFAVTYVWRMLGAVAASRLNPEGEVLLWVRAVATALVAALVARIVLVPEGLLAGTLALSRIGGLAAGVGVFFWRRHVESSVVAAILAFFALEALLRAIP